MRRIAAARTKAKAGQLSPAEWASTLWQFGEFEPVARDTCIYYLKSSGERITDLLTMSDSDLRKWYLLVKQQNEKQRERMEQARKAQIDRQRRAKR